MPLLTWSYWFSLEARELLPVAKLVLLGGFAALVVAGIAISVIAKKKSGSMFWTEGGKRFAAIAIKMGLLGLLFVFFTHELTYFFGARFWYLLWIILFAVLMVRWLRYVTRVVPKQSAAFSEKARIEKWLPKSR